VGTGKQHRFFGLRRWQVRLYFERGTHLPSPQACASKKEKKNKKEEKEKLTRHLLRRAVRHFVHLRVVCGIIFLEMHFPKIRVQHVVHFYTNQWAVKKETKMTKTL